MTQPGLLCKPLYSGRRVWNRSCREKDPHTNRKAHIVRDKSKWIETPLPHLRIIDEELWKSLGAILEVWGWRKNRRPRPAQRLDGATRGALNGVRQGEEHNLTWRIVGIATLPARFPSA
jgi:recombinase